MKELLKLLGVETEAEAIAAVARFNSLAEATLQATGARTSQEAIDTFRAQASLVRSIEACTGVKGAEAVAKVEAWKASAGRVAELEAQAAAEAKKNTDREARDAIDLATREGRLAPANREKAEHLYAELGLKGLKVFLETLPQANVPGAGPGVQQPAQPRQGGTGVLTAEEKQVAKLCGKTEAEMLEAKKLWDEAAGGISESQMRASATPFPGFFQVTRAA